MPLFGSRKPRAVVGSPNAVRRSSMSASGLKISRRTAPELRRLVQPWQMRAFSYYDLLGEIKYSANFYSRMLSPLRLYAAEKDEDGDWVETTDADAIDALERIQDPGGGRTGLLSAYGRLMFLTGEALLFVSPDEELGDGTEKWEMLSSDELRVQDGVYLRYRAPSIGVEEYRDPGGDGSAEEDWFPVSGEAVAYRLWQRHPRYSMLADSTMQGVLDICEELVLLTQAVRARARSRLAGSGILLVDDSISPAPDEPVPDEDPDEDPFLAALTEAMTTPIEDEGAASQVVPLTVRATAPESGKVADLMHHLQLIDPTQLYPETGLRTECIKRLAIGLDMPPEELLGLQDSNHWTAWMIDEQTWKAHGQPKAQQLCDDLTASYFRPYLRGIKGDDAARYSIAYDATAVINHPDRTADAKDLYDKRAIGKRALREAAGFDEEDEPSDDELAEMIGIATRDSSLAWYGIPSIRTGGLEVQPGVDAAGGTETGTPETPTAGGDVEGGPPAEGGEREPPGAVVGALVARAMGASDLALLRSREAAGARLRSMLRRDSDLLAEFEAVKNRDLAPALGRERARSLGAPSEKELVAGARQLVLDALSLYGVTAQVAEVIADNIERHAARTLYDKRPAPMPESFAAYVAGMLASGNGHAKRPALVD